MFKQYGIHCRGTNAEYMKDIVLKNIRYSSGDGEKY